MSQIATAQCLLILIGASCVFYFPKKKQNKSWMTFCKRNVSFVFFSLSPSQANLPQRSTFFYTGLACIVYSCTLLTVALLITTQLQRILITQIIAGKFTLANSQSRAFLFKCLRAASVAFQNAFALRLRKQPRYFFLQTFVLLFLLWKVVLLCVDQ